MASASISAPVGRAWCGGAGAEEAAAAERAFASVAWMVGWMGPAVLPAEVDRMEETAAVAVDALLCCRAVRERPLWDGPVGGPASSSSSIAASSTITVESSAPARSAGVALLGLVERGRPSASEAAADRTSMAPEVAALARIRRQRRRKEEKERRGPPKRGPGRERGESVQRSQTGACRRVQVSLTAARAAGRDETREQAGRSGPGQRAPRGRDQKNRSPHSRVRAFLPASGLAPALTRAGDGQDAVEARGADRRHPGLRL